MLYVDHARISYQRMLVNHLMADTSQELQQPEIDLGLPRGSVQHPGEAKELLDVCEEKRRLAIKMGARPISPKELVEIVRRRRQKLGS